MVRFSNPPYGLCAACGAGWRLKNGPAAGGYLSLARPLGSTLGYWGHPDGGYASHLQSSLPKGARINNGKRGMQ